MSKKDLINHSFLQLLEDQKGDITNRNNLFSGFSIFRHYLQEHRIPHFSLSL